VCTVSPDCAMHPLRPLQIEVAWVDESENTGTLRAGRITTTSSTWWSAAGTPYLQGGRQFQSARRKSGVLHYRICVELLRIRRQRELGRTVEPCIRPRPQGSRRAVGGFCSLDYMDLHILKNNCGIGLHRQPRQPGDIFPARRSGGDGYRDWCKSPQRERCFEVRTLQAALLAAQAGRPARAHERNGRDITLLMSAGTTDRDATVHESPSPRSRHNIEVGIWPEEENAPMGPTDRPPGQRSAFGHLLPRVSVRGDFNNWSELPLERDANGYWYADVPGVAKGTNTSTSFAATARPLEARPVRPGADLGSAGPTAACFVHDPPTFHGTTPVPDAAVHNLIIYQLHVGAFFAWMPPATTCGPGKPAVTSTSSTSSNISLNWA